MKKETQELEVASDYIESLIKNTSPLKTIEELITDPYAIHDLIKKAGVT